MAIVRYLDLPRRAVGADGHALVDGSRIMAITAHPVGAYLRTAYTESLDT
jgi:hypothetical protein